jgi:hypothetical protein
LAAGTALTALSASAHARVTRIVIDQQVSPAFNDASLGSAGPYETLAGHVAEGFLLEADMKKLVAEAEASDVLK